MHEYTFMKSVIDAVLKQIEMDKITEPIKQLNLTVGILEVHSEAAARQAYEVLTLGTALANTPLHIALVPVRLTCTACGFDGEAPPDDSGHHHHDPILPCPRCGEVCVAQGGQGLQALELVLE